VLRSKPINIIPFLLTGQHRVEMCCKVSNVDDLVLLSLSCLSFLVGDLA